MFKWKSSLTSIVLALLYTVLFSVAPAFATFSGGNGQVLYNKWSAQTDENGDYRQHDGNVYTANPDGSNEQKQNFLSGLTSSFDLSPDGDHVAYVEAVDQNMSNIIVSKLDGTDKHVAYYGYGIADPQFLSNGKTIAFNQCASSCQYTFSVDIDGGNHKSLINSTYGRLSPDGTKYIRVKDVNGNGIDSAIGFTSGLDGTNPNRTLTNINTTVGRCTNYCFSQPVWAPDNVRIAYWKYVDLDTYKLIIQNTSTLQTNEYQYSGRPNSTMWSPDGQQILFTSDHSSTKPFYGYPFNPRMLSFNIASTSFTLQGSSRQANLLGWKATGNQNAPVFPTITLSNIYRFYSPLVKHHLFTADANEYNHIRANFPSSVWTYETVAFSVNGTSNCSANRSVYRFYSEQLTTHLYTMDENEKSTLIAKYPPNVWRYEGVAYCADKQQLTNTKPVHRFYSEKFKTHLYTIDQNETNSIIARYSTDVYRYEGIAYYAYQ